METIIRHSAPSKLDQAPKGTECKVENGEEYQLYVQCSSQEEDPQWQLMGTYQKEEKKD
jgi:hypothetical protein